MVELPGKALGHAATSAEYVAYGIQQLAAKSKTGKAFVIGHSQGGGLSIPWVRIHLELYSLLSCDFVLKNAIRALISSLTQNNSFLDSLHLMVIFTGRSSAGPSAQAWYALIHLIHSCMD